LSRYDEFLQRYANHPWTVTAELGRLHCLEAKGQFQEAADGFGAFADMHGEHYQVPLALFGKARCLEQLQRLEDAKAVYEDFIAANPDSRWVPRVEEMLEALGLRLARRERGMGAALPPTMPMALPTNGAAIPTPVIDFSPVTPVGE
jgi:tetratricopeptide (TPR) repeat protein